MTEEKFDQCRELTEMIFNKFGKVVKVEYGHVVNLGDWFYIDTGSYFAFRLGITFESAKSFVERTLSEDSLR